MPGPGPVAVVTDSTAYLPEDLARLHGLTVVPLQVVVGGRSLAEGVQVSSAEVAQALRARRPVTTSRPSPRTFVEAYRALAEGGAHAVVSVHLSGDLSGTVEAARLAAAEVRAGGPQVLVVDSRCVGMGLGFAAMEAARRVAAGSDAPAAAQAASRMALGSVTWFYVDSLEYLRRGGRIGPAAAVLGSALAVKPLLHIVDGRIEPLERVRTTARALARIEELGVAEAGSREVLVAVQHLGAPDRARELAQRLTARLPGSREVVVGEIGAVVGAHVGPGMLGLVVAPRLVP